MTDHRSVLFARLAAQARPAELPKAWRSRRNFEDHFARFRNALAAVYGETVRCAGFAEAVQVLEDELAAAGIRNIVANGEPQFERVRPEGVQVHRLPEFAGRPGEWRTACAQAGAGLTGAEALLAETGSVVIHSGAGKSRMVSLLPPVHFVLCAETLLTTDIFTWLAGRGGSWPANAVLISGPSKTADIEQTMTVGVHGPRRLIVILYRENNE